MSDTQTAPQATAGTALSPMQYLDRAMGALRDMGLMPGSTAEAPINALLENYEATKEWDRYIDLTRQLLSVESDPKIRFAKLSQIGDIYAEEIQECSGRY